MESFELKSCNLISYSLRSLDQNAKMKLIRELQGYSENKNGKKYVHKGLIDLTEAQKLGSNVILVSVWHFDKFQELFKKYKVKTEVKEVWIR